jgi:hypothetical protein
MKSDMELLEQLLNKELVSEDSTAQVQGNAAGSFASPSTTWQPLLKATLQQRGLRSHCHLSRLDLKELHVGLLDWDHQLLQAQQLAL